MKIFWTLAVLFGTWNILAQPLLLEEWCGQYKGVMYLEFPDKTKDSLQLDLTIATTDDPKVFVYRFEYSSIKYGNSEKDYRLELDEKYEDGIHYLLNEQNGIYIDQVILNNALYGHYEVLKMDYSTVLRKLDDNHLYFELICSRADRGRNSASEPDEAGTVYQVASNQVYTIQYATLIKQ